MSEIERACHDGNSILESGKLQVGELVADKMEHKVFFKIGSISTDPNHKLAVTISFLQKVCFQLAYTMRNTVYL